MDENGIPIKKQKSVRKQKVVEEISLKFRVVSQSEEEEQEQFYPSAQNSDNENKLED